MGSSLSGFTIVVGICLILLAAGSQSIYALTSTERYNSGYSHGCSDGKIGRHSYLVGSGGASAHTADFMRGYNAGHSKCYGNTGNNNYGNGNIERLKVDMWIWGTGKAKINDVLAWVSFKGKTITVRFDYSTATDWKSEYRYECHCYVKMFHKVFLFPPTSKSFSGVFDFFDTCVRNMKTQEQNCHSNSWFLGTWARMQIPNTT